MVFSDDSCNDDHEYCDGIGSLTKESEAYISVFDCPTALSYYKKMSNENDSKLICDKENIELITKYILDSESSKQLTYKNNDGTFKEKCGCTCYTGICAIKLQ